MYGILCTRLELEFIRNIISSSLKKLIILYIYLFIYLWLSWVFVAVRGLLVAVASLVAEHGL